VSGPAGQVISRATTFFQTRASSQQTVSRQRNRDEDNGEQGDWQTHIAFVWLLVAASTGLVLTLPIPPTLMIGLGWGYGIAGLIGFLAQIVVGIQGRLLPLYGWYRMMEKANMEPPTRSAHTLGSHGLAKAILVAWTLGVPLLISGLTGAFNWMIVAGSALLLVGVALNATQAITIVTPD
jgi:hypothetical protein